MNNYFLMYNDEKLDLEKIRFIVINLFVAFLPLDKFYSTLLFYVLIVFTLLDYKSLDFKKIPKTVWIFQIPFILSVIGYFYSENKLDAQNLISRQLGLFLLPILIPLSINITKERVKQLLTTFSISCTLVIIYLFIYNIIILYNLNLPFNNFFSKDFLNHNFSAPINLHASYLSIYVSLSFIFLLLNVYNIRSKYLKVIVTCSLLILFIGLLFLASRNVFISTTLITIFILIINIKKNKVFTTLILSFYFFIGLSFILSNDFLNSRFRKDLFEDINLSSSVNKTNLVESRYERWEMGMELVKNKPLIGYGTGDEISNLKIKYRENKFIVSFVENFNIHNQYISILIKHGIIGLTIFLLSLCYFYYIAIKSKNYIYLVFLAIISFFFFTENVLDSNKGIFFFGFFNVFFGYYSNYKLFNIKSLLK